MYSHQCFARKRALLLVRLSSYQCDTIKHSWWGCVFCSAIQHNVTTYTKKDLKGEGRTMHLFKVFTKFILKNYFFEHLITVQQRNGNLTFIWFAKKDNLMLLNWWLINNSRLLVSIWMFNIWMEWLIFTKVFFLESSDFMVQIHICLSLEKDTLQVVE